VAPESCNKPSGAIFCFLVSFPLKDAKFSLPEAVNLLADLKIKLS